jgi:FAD/FMN-containing dehydrogenase/Fe-S oxidoreductase
MKSESVREIADHIFHSFAQKVEGELFYSSDPSHLSVRKVYSTDASLYQELPRAVFIPRDKEDIRKAVAFADTFGITLIPRSAGTSLAGQVVGNGMVVDVSRYMVEILEVNADEKWVRVQPGVIRDDLNAYLKSYGLQFGPETSTANRAMIGGMIGNNSCGLHSLVWGSTRDSLLEVEAVFSDCKVEQVTSMDSAQWEQACTADTTLGNLYRCINEISTDKSTVDSIRSNFPAPDVKRRNSGYALDALVDHIEHSKGGINLCPLIAGSEGTLCIITEAKLALMDIPSDERAMVLVHASSLREALLANKFAVQISCDASELVDDMILGFARNSPRYASGASFVVGEPKAILMVEFISKYPGEAIGKAGRLIGQLSEAGLGYAYPVLQNEDIHSAWELRKAGLGLLRNLPGDAQPVNLIEDGAVSAQDLPQYIEDVTAMLDSLGVRFCIYAHAGPGELHIEPILDLKTSEGREKMRKIATETAALLKKYRGSLSGEHGDGRLRGEFIPFMMGDEMISLFRKIKTTCDPKGIFNRNKILDTPPIDEHLRYSLQAESSTISTFFDFSMEGSMLRLTEKCSGSGDCRRSAIGGGLMCPSYMATRSEKDTTRARANILRQFITDNGWKEKKDAVEVMEIFDLCLSCKGCKTECPSGVDITKLKAEFTQQYHKKYGASLRSQWIAHFTSIMQYAYRFRGMVNGLNRMKAVRQVVNGLAGFHPKRSLPKISSQKLTARKIQPVKKSAVSQSGKVHFFVDEFSEFTDADIAEKAIRFMQSLGYDVVVHPMTDSGRALLSKGFVEEASVLANRNISYFGESVSEETPLVGIEPSAILSFRDEYPSLAKPAQRSMAKELSHHSYTFVEWVYREMKAGRIRMEHFTDAGAHILLHEHCHQKALGEKDITCKVLSLPENYTVEMIPSGCCGMAGSFGYEKEHYDLSMQIGELVLFPHIRKAGSGTLLAASGTSCRHQILDGTARKALHPAEILFAALRS